jgi:hypothetical protein
VVAIGLGFESFFDLLFFQLANITQDVTLPVAPDCSGSPYFEDPLYKLCAGGLNQGLCAGDSGGPLVRISGGGSHPRWFGLAFVQLPFLWRRTCCLCTHQCWRRMDQKCHLRSWKRQ